jgi:hypothetical protein
MSFFAHYANRLLVALLSFVVATPLFAADGWYLLIPPRSEYSERAPFLQGYKILDQKPLTRWAQQGAYDSASECEAVRDSFLKVEQDVYSKSSDQYIKDVGAGKDAAVLRMQRSLTETHNANVSAFMASRCVRSNDPRLLP